MSRAHDFLPIQAKQDLMQLIYTDFNLDGKRLRPTAISDVQGSNFFPWHNNRYDGYFIKVWYADGRSERWFVVDVSGYSDNDWFLEEIF